MNPPPYDIFPILPGEHILLRPILPADIGEVIDISYYDGQAAETQEQAATMQEKINRDYAAGNSIHWGIADKVTGRIVGTCGYYRGFEQGTGELGCVLRPPFRGRGYMTEALRLAIDFGWREMRLQRITAVTTPQNLKAIQLLERLQFKKVADMQDGKVEYAARKDD